MAIVIQYSKSSTKNGHDTLIPHVLNAFCQDIIKTVVFVTHSFAEQIFQVLYPDHNNITILWYNQLFVQTDCSFITENILSILQCANLKAIQVQLGIRDYCQLSICVWHAYCSTLEELIRMRKDINIVT